MKFVLNLLAIMLLLSGCVSRARIRLPATNPRLQLQVRTILLRKPEITMSVSTQES